jgi:hypothetical protein
MGIGLLLGYGEFNTGCWQEAGSGCFHHLRFVLLHGLEASHGKQSKNFVVYAVIKP